RDHQAGGDVPPVELELPEAVEAPARHVAEVERGAAVAPHAAGALHRSPEEVEVVALRVAHVVGETGGEQRAAELALARHADRAAIAARPSTPHGLEQVVAPRVVAGRDRADAAALGADRDAEAGIAVRVVDGAVERIDHPAPLRAAVGVRAALLGEHVVARALAAQRLHDVPLAGAIDLG